MKKNSWLKTLFYILQSPGRFCGRHWKGWLAAHARTHAHTPATVTNRHHQHEQTSEQTERSNAQIWTARLAAAFAKMIKVIIKHVYVLRLHFFVVLNPPFLPLRSNVCKTSVTMNTKLNCFFLLLLGLHLRSCHGKNNHVVHGHTYRS